MKILFFAALGISCTFPTAHCAANEGSQFIGACNYSLYNRPLKTDIPSYNSQSHLHDFYQKGLLECETYYRGLSQSWMNGQQNLKGNDLLLRLTGKILWAFGPKSSCPTHSKCWYGVLSCGEMKIDGVRMNFVKSLTAKGMLPSLTFGEYELHQKRRFSRKFSDEYPRPVVPSFKGWSMRSIGLNMRVVGMESVAPILGVVALNGSVDVLIAEYTLTIPGEYQLHINLQDFYPGMLFKWKENDLKHGFDVVNGIYLGYKGYKGCETCLSPVDNCDNKHFRCCGCHSETAIVGAPFTTSSVYRGDMCEIEMIEVKQRPSLRSGVWPPPPPLPYCRNGNHVGRWLRIPDNVVALCEAETFYSAFLAGKITLPTNEVKAHRQYIQHVEKLDGHNILNQVLDSWANTSLPYHERVYRWELSRYVNGNICRLLNLHHRESRPYYDSPVELYAPYQCRYRIQSVNEIAQCFNRKQFNNIMFIGDSMIRTLAIDFARYTDNGLYTMIPPAEPSAWMNMVYGPTGERNISLHYMQAFNPTTYDYYRAVTNKNHSYDAMIQNYAYVHMMEYDMMRFRHTLHNAPLTKALREQTLGHVGLNLPRVQIHQTAKVLQDCKVNRGGHSLEHFRRYNNVMTEEFRSDVDDGRTYQLDEWLLTAAKLDLKDGLHFEGVARRMASVIVANIICGEHVKI